ncbi:MAG: LacI family transcriptional regulator [Lachnospiraceae bacterium]|nr:LacI family transcriptional regulator [Lachnospiraceae bacterium]
MHTVTIQEVAQRAKTSPSTVSRVINNLGNVTPELTKTVWEAIQELDYNPNHAARSLVKRKTNSIGIIVNNLHDPFFYDLLRGFEDGALQTSYNVMFCSVVNGDVAMKEKCVRHLSNGVVDGIILYGSYLTDEAAIRYLHENGREDYVMIENDIPDLFCNKLLVDNVGGARQAVEYLIEQGHQRIAHICGNPNKKVTMDRLNGYVDTMRDHGLEVRENYIQHTSSKYTSGYICMKRLLEREDRPTAVFCSDDAIASYAIRAAQDSGLDIPKDLSIIGFDHQAILPDRYRGPEITTVEQPLYTIGKESVCLLSQYLDSKEPLKPVTRLYETNLVVRETVGFCNM